MVASLQYLRFSCLKLMSRVNVVFVIFVQRSAFNSG